MVLGDRHRHRRLDRGEPARGQPRGELLVDIRGGGLGQDVGGLGDLAGLPRLHRQLLDQPPDLRQPVLEVEGVGDQLHPGQRGHAEGGGDRLRARTPRPRGCPPRPATRPDGARRAGSRRPRWRRRCRRWRGAARTTARRAAAWIARRRGLRSSSPRAGRGASRRRGPRPPPAVPSRPLRAWINPSTGHRQSGPGNRVVERVWGNPKVKLSSGRCPRAGQRPQLRRTCPGSREDREPGSDRSPRRTCPRSCEGPQPPTSRRPPTGSRGSALRASHLDHERSQKSGPSDRGGDRLGDPDQVGWCDLQVEPASAGGHVDRGVGQGGVVDDGG